MDGNDGALAIALDYISLHNFIEDRETQLTGRLVCRSWRNHDAFSGKITSVTLHKLADIQLIPHFFPAQPPPLDGNIRVFPNLRNLIVDENISTRLANSPEVAELLLHYCQEFDLEIRVENTTQYGDILPFLRTLPRISALDFVWGRGFGNAVSSLRALAGLTKLVLGNLRCSGELFRFPESLSTLETLKHLELRSASADRLDNLVECLSLGSRLNNVTRFDLSVEMPAMSLSYALLVNLRNIVQTNAPQTLHSCTLKATWSSNGPNTEYSFEIESLKHRVPQVANGRLQMKVQGGRGSTVSEELLKALHCGPPSRQLGVVLNIEPFAADDRFMLDLIGFIGVEKVAIDWRFLHIGDMFPRKPFRVFSSRLSVPLPSVCQVLRMSFRADSGLFRSDFPEQLPYLFPNLRHLTLIAEHNYDFTELTSLCKLTKLTYLSLDGVTTPNDGLMLPPPFFPPSLRSLHVKNIKGISFPTLEHLTRLYFYAPGLCLDSLYSCRAPLKELSFDGPSVCEEVDLRAVASAFPSLEALDIRWASCCDYSTLSTLQYLQRLSLQNIKHEGSHTDCICSKSLGMLTAVKKRVSFY